MGATDWELVDDGSWNGLRKWMRGDDEGAVQVSYEQVNLQSVLDANKAAQNESFDKRSEFWHAATIPPIIEVEWLTKYGVRLKDPNHAPAVKKLLNSSEYSYLKRAPIVL